MNNRLAIWSWILPLIGYGIYLIFALTHVLRTRSLEIFSIILFTIFFTIAGLIIGIISITKSEKNKKDSKVHAIIGIILSTVLLFYGIFLTFGGLIGDYKPYS